jgi:hypothetical protein
LAASVALGAAGCGEGSQSALEETLKGTLQQAGFENPLAGSPRTYEGAFSIAPDRFMCALRTMGAYCVTDDGSAVVSISDAGELSSGQTQGRTFLPGDKPIDIDGGDVLLNKAETIACGSQEGRGVWCIAADSGTGFLTDGSSSGFTRLNRK